MRQLDFFDGFETDTPPEQGYAVTAALRTFTDDAAYITDKGAAAAIGDAYYNTTSNLIRYYVGSGWINLADESSAQTLSNKAFSDSVLFSELGSDPATPSSGKRRIFAKAGGFYQKNSAGIVAGFGEWVASGTRGAPNAITAAGGITATTEGRQMQFVQGSGGAVDITATPQISAGSRVGQELCLVGCDDTDTLLLENGTGLILDGECLLAADSEIILRWDGTNWREGSRNGI